MPYNGPSTLQSNPEWFGPTDQNGQSLRGSGQSLSVQFPHWKDGAMNLAGYPHAVAQGLNPPAPTRPLSGVKYDTGKAPVTRGAIRCFPRALAAIAMLSDRGAAKYDWYNWRKVPDGINRYADAAGRHDVAIGRGEIVDAETGSLHLTSRAWNTLAELELVLTAAEKDNETPV